MLATSDVIAFAPARDLARSRSFYETTLGLPVVDENAYACVLNAHGTMLRLTAVAEVAHPGYTTLGWHVTNIAETVAGLESRGVVFLRYEGIEQDGQDVWTTPSGGRIAWFTDPDGKSCLSPSSTDCSPARANMPPAKGSPERVIPAPLCCQPVV